MNTENEILIEKNDLSLVWASYQEYYKTPEKAVNAFVKLFSYHLYESQDEKKVYSFPDGEDSYEIPRFKKLILANQLDILPNLDFNYKGLYKVPVNLFKLLCEKFKEKNIDLLLKLQKPVFSFDVNAYYSDVQHEYDNKFVKYSVYFTHQVINGLYDLDTKEKNDIFIKVLEKHQDITTPSSHKNAILLLHKAIDFCEPQDMVIKLFKNFVANNPTIHPDAKNEMDSLKQKIKNWDLSNYFTIAEQKMLFSNNNSGLMVKEVEALYYFFDLNLLKMQYPNIDYVETLDTNIQNMIYLLPNILGNTPHYVGSTSVVRSPEIHLTIMFEEGYKKMYVEDVNNLIKNICSSEKELQLNEFDGLVPESLKVHRKPKI